MAITNYTITLGVDGTLTVTPGQVNTSSSDLAFIGPGGAEYGRHYAQNFAKLLTNFATTTSPPTHPKQGQLWFKSSTKQLRVYTSDGWKEIYSEGATTSLAVSVNQGGTGLTTVGPPGYILRVNTAGTSLEYSSISSIVGGAYVKTDGTSVPLADNQFDIGTGTNRFRKVYAVTFEGNSTSSDKLATPRTISLSGDSSGSIVFDGSNDVVIPVNLPSTGVTAGTYTKVSVDAKGRVTSATNLANGDVVAGLGYAPVNRAGDTMTGDLVMTKTNAAISLNSSGICYLNFNNSTGTSNEGQLIYEYSSNSIQFRLKKAGAITSIAAVVDSGMYVAGNIRSSQPATVGDQVPRLDQVQSLIATTSIPVGMVAAFATGATPSGWLKCNGAAISRTAYAALFSLVGTWFGHGDGSTTFNLPDLRGEFIRGFDDGRGVDAGRVWGWWQGDAIRNITGAFGGNVDDGGSAEKTGAFYHNGVGWNGANGDSGGGIIVFDASRVVPTAGENRPRNLPMMYFIKY